MEISHRQAENLTIVAARGRLDGTWADHLGQALDEHLRGGRDRVVLDMSDIEYISSLGLRSLLGAFKRYKAVGGSFAVSQLRPHVLEVLEMAGLAGMLLAAEVAPAAAPPASGPAGATSMPEAFVRAGVAGQFHRAGSATFRLRPYGRRKNCWMPASRARASTGWRWTPVCWPSASGPSARHTTIAAAAMASSLPLPALPPTSPAMARAPATRS